MHSLFRKSIPLTYKEYTGWAFSYNEKKIVSLWLFLFIISFTLGVQVIF